MHYNKYKTSFSRIIGEVKAFWHPLKIFVLKNMEIRKKAVGCYRNKLWFKRESEQFWFFELTNFLYYLKIHKKKENGFWQKMNFLKLSYFWVKSVWKS